MISQRERELENTLRELLAMHDIAIKAPVTSLLSALPARRVEAAWAEARRLVDVTLVRFLPSSMNSGPVTVTNKHASVVLHKNGMPLKVGDLVQGQTVIFDVSTGEVQMPSKSPYGLTDAASPLDGLHPSDEGVAAMPYEVLPEFKNEDAVLSACYTPHNGIRISIQNWFDADDRLSEQFDDKGWDTFVRVYDFEPDEARLLGEALIRWADADTHVFHAHGLSMQEDGSWKKNKCPTCGYDYNDK